MTEFGQTNPSVPQIYWDQTTRQFTKTGLVSHMCRALTTVGMVPLTQWWPYDALNTANAELPQIANDNTFSTQLFAFDFPDSSTFSIDNTLYRPIIVVASYYGNLTTATQSNRNDEMFRVDSAIRLDGATSMADTRARWRQFTPNFYGWGRYSDATVSTGLGGIGDLSRGMYIQKADWRPWSGAGQVDDSLLSVKNFFVYLGPAGLFIFLGDGATADLFGTIMAAGFAFGGARLPDRAATPDTNLNRINPILHMPLRETETEIWNPSTPRLRSYIHGMQHDLTPTLDLVAADLLNLENTEIPFYPDARPNTVPSPRALSSGQGAHILGRVVVIPKEQFSSTTTLMGPVNARIIGSDTRPLFSQVFACPNFRFADITAPMGTHQDPDTLLDWRIVPYPSVGMRLALYAENAVTTSVLDVGAKTLLSTLLYSLTSTTQTGTGAFPVGSPVTVVSVPGGVNASVVHNTIPGQASTSRWQSTASTDDLTCDMTAFTSTGQLDLIWTIQPSASDPVDSVYELVFDCRVRGGTEDAHGLAVSLGLNGGLIVGSITDGTTARTALRTAGANTGHYAYDYKTYTVSLVRDASLANSPLVFRFRADRVNDASDATVIEIKAIKVNRYRYV